MGCTRGSHAVHTLGTHRGTHGVLGCIWRAYQLRDRRGRLVEQLVLTGYSQGTHAVHTLGTHRGTHGVLGYIWRAYQLRDRRGRLVEQLVPAQRSAAAADMCACAAFGVPQCVRA
jgi:hypothetical protein